MTASKKLIQASAGVGGGDFYPYTVDNSARFEDGDLPYLYRATSTPDDATRGAISFWVKRGNLSSAMNPISCAGTSVTACYFQADNTLNIYDYMNGGGLMQYVTTRVFRDTSAWYHILLIINTNEATALDRVKLYVNGVRETSFSTSTTGNQSASSAWLIAQNCNIGRYASGANLYYDGYMSEVARIDGTVYSPTDFGEDKNGVWVPKDLSALSFGSEGFYMKFGNSGALGTDSSGNSNNFTSSGLTSSDQMTDTPTNNFATANALTQYTGTLSNGNLNYASGVAANPVMGTIGLPTSGEWYWEVSVTTVAEIGIGINKAQFDTGIRTHYYRQGGASNGFRIEGTLSTANPASYTNGDVIGVYFNADSSEISWYKNGSLQASAQSLSTVEGWFPTVEQVSGAGSTVGVYNFGQTAFAHTPPGSALALSTANLPEPTIGPNSATLTSEVFAPILYTGNGTSQSISTLDFQPDWVWIKNRDAADSHMVFDATRGATVYLNSDTSNAEVTDAQTLTSFDSTGFSVGSNVAVNTNAEDYVAWNWKGNGSGVSNTDGDIRHRRGLRL